MKNKNKIRLQIKLLLVRTGVRQIDVCRYLGKTRAQMAYILGYDNYASAEMLELIKETILKLSQKNKQANNH